MSDQLKLIIRLIATGAARISKADGTDSIAILETGRIAILCEAKLKAKGTVIRGGVSEET